jgi:hypothetical protein
VNNIAPNNAPVLGSDFAAHVKIYTRVKFFINFQQNMEILFEKGADF